MWTSDGVTKTGDMHMESSRWNYSDWSHLPSDKGRGDSELFRNCSEFHWLRGALEFLFGQELCLAHDSDSLLGWEDEGGLAGAGYCACGHGLLGGHW